jgi:1-hydroxycarotenoid 3,4-desaturase
MEAVGKVGQRVVVVGAGMGGLSAAIRLAAAGAHVTVIESADVPGGKARAVASAAGPVDAGPTVLTLRGEVDALFALAGRRTADEVDLIPLAELARHFWPDGSCMDLFPDREANVEAIRAFAGPREAEAFLRFDRMAEALFAAFEHPVIRAPRPALGQIAQTALTRPRLWPALVPGRSLTALLRSYFGDPRLVQLFGRYATYVGGRPDHAPAVLALIWRAEAAGVWAVREGLHGLAAALARAAEGLGAEFRYTIRARRILRQGGRVTGVEVDGGRALPCDICIFNGDPGALQDGLLGNAAREAMPPRRHAPSLSAWIWSFAAEPHGPPLAYHNVFFTEDPGAEFGPIGAGKMPEDPTLYVCAMDRATRPVAGPERFEIIMNAPAGYQGTSGEEKLCHTRTFPRLRRFGLSFTPEPEAKALTTPAILAERFPGTSGAIYGQSPEGTFAAFKRPTARTRLPGLYLAGGGAHPGAGVPMALLSGKHAAEAVMADLTSPSRSARTAMPGGMSTESLRTGRAPSQ